MGEQELSERCKAGDNEARRLLYEKYAGGLLALCRRYVRERAIAEDLLHDGFIHIFGVIDKFQWRGDGSLRAWLERVMLNKVLQYINKNDLLRQTIEISDIGDSISPPSIDGDEVDKVPPALLQQFISELPIGYRTVFDLFVMQHKSHKEIAKLLNINEKSSSSQLFRAKSLLIKRIKEYSNETE